MENLDNQDDFIGFRRSKLKEKVVSIIILAVSVLLEILSIGIFTYNRFLSYRSAYILMI